MLRLLSLELPVAGATPARRQPALGPVVSLSVSPQPKTGRQMSGTLRALWRFEFFLGPIGMRAEAGYSMYFDRGVSHKASTTT